MGGGLRRASVSWKAKNRAISRIKAGKITKRQFMKHFKERVKFHIDEMAQEMGTGIPVGRP